MSAPPIIYVTVSGSQGVSTIVTEVSENTTTVVNVDNSPVQTNVFTTPSAFAQHAYNSTTASYAETSSIAFTASYALTSAGTIDNATSASYAQTASYAETVGNSDPFPYAGNPQITGSLEVTENVTSNQFSLYNPNGLFVMTGSLSTGILGVTENINPPIPTASFSGATIEYMAQRPGGLRLGVVLALWSGSTYRFTDVSTTDIGDTDDLIAGFLPVGENIIFQVNSAGSGSDPWSVQAMFKLFPRLV